MNFLPGEHPRARGRQKRPRAAGTRLLRGPGSAGGGARPGCPGGSSGAACAKPEKAPTCAAARSERGARPGRAGARGQRGDGLGGRGGHRAPWRRASSRRGPGGGPEARLPPLLHPAEVTAGPAAAAATGTVAAKEEEEVSARDSRFLLPGWASAGEARGGQDRGSPDSVPRDLRGPRGAPRPHHTAPCDRRSGTAGTGESHASDSCCSAGLPLPPCPRRLAPSRRPSSARPGAGVGARPSGGSWLWYSWGARA